MSDTVVILDTEFTTWKGALENNWGEDWQHREIVQIGAVKVDVDTLEIKDKFDRLVLPEINPLLSDFFIELTGITNEQVQMNGIPFEEAFEKFTNFVDNDTAYCYGWDGDVFEENVHLIGKCEWHGVINFETLHPYFKGQGVDTSKINSGKLAEHFGVDIEIREHNAMDDVYSIHAALKHLKGEGKDLPFAKNRKAA